MIAGSATKTSSQLFTEVVAIPSRSIGRKHEAPPRCSGLDGSRGSGRVAAGDSPGELIPRWALLARGSLMCP